MPKTLLTDAIAVTPVPHSSYSGRSGSDDVFRNEYVHRVALLSALILGLSGACAHASGTCNLYNPVLYTKGTTYRIVYRISEGSLHNYRDVENTKVMGPAIFHGYHAIDVRRHTTESTVSSIVDNYYGKGKKVMYSYGVRSHEGGMVYEQYNKPAISFLKRYVINVPYTETDTEHITGHGTHYTITARTTTTFLGKKRITIPAGTFTTCKIKIQGARLANGVQPGVGYDWFVASGRYAGLMLKNIYVKPATGSTIPLETKVALSLRLNGK